MRDKLQRFMYGRYGNDDLNRAISIVTLGSIIAEMMSERTFFILFTFLYGFSPGVSLRRR